MEPDPNNQQNGGSGSSQPNQPNQNSRPIRAMEIMIENFEVKLKLPRNRHFISIIFDSARVSMWCVYACVVCMWCGVCACVSMCFHVECV